MADRKFYLPRTGKMNCTFSTSMICASEVITSLNYTKIACFAGSFGAGILAKTMCVAPEKIEKAVLYVPAGENDCLFPAKRVIPRANKYIQHCTTYVLKTRGHINVLTKEEKKMIVDFLL